MRRLFTALAVLTALFMGSTLLTVFATPAEAGPMVSRAQARLNDLRCQAGPVDGQFGEWTKAAVMRFQSRHAMRVDGRLTETTRNRLYSKTARRCDLRAVPKSGSGKRIVISRTQNWVWLVRSDGSVRAQGGIIDNPAEFSRGWKKVASYCGRAAKIRSNRSAGGLLLQHFTRFAPCGYGFHRIPQYSSGAQIHADQLLGTNLRRSSGCIRVSASMARHIWEHGTVGTRVYVL